MPLTIKDCLRIAYIIWFDNIKNTIKIFILKIYKTILFSSWQYNIISIYEKWFKRFQRLS